MHVDPGADHDITTVFNPIEQPEEAARFYHENGYMVARGLIPEETCAKTLNAFRSHIKPFDGRLMRQTTSRPERHNISEQGLITNPMLDVHETCRGVFPEFYDAATEVLLHRNIVDTLTELFQDDPLMVQTMYFESSRGTDPHMDTHFIDSTKFGQLAGVWIALEDIGEEAGRFSVYPKSHRIYDETLFDVETREIAEAYEAHQIATIRGYQIEGKSFSLTSVTKARRLFNKLIKASGLQAYHPPLKAGDVVFFSSYCMHGSAKPKYEGGGSRNSLTAHWVGKSNGYTRCRVLPGLPLKLEQVRGAWVQVHDREPASPA